MDLAAQLRALEAAQGDPARLALATVDLAYPSVTHDERAALKRCLEAAAIPHWFDEAILSALLEIPGEESAARIDSLRVLRVLEPFRARGDKAFNVHEAARLALRKAMATYSQEGFRRLSKSAATYFAGDFTSTGRIEWIYHLLSADPDVGALKCEALNREWIDTARPEDFHALALTLGELETTGLVSGAARVEVLLCLLDARSCRGESASLGPEARKVIDLAHDAGLVSGEAHANCILGDSLAAQGDLGKALAAYEEFLRISLLNLALEPSEARWIRRVVVAHARVGSVVMKQGKLDLAELSFQKSLDLVGQLAAQESSNLSWQFLLASRQRDMGHILLERGRVEEALVSFRGSLAIAQGLFWRDPSNAAWQRDLASAHNSIGHVSRLQGKLQDALVAFRESLRIVRRLVEQDPSNAPLERELATELNLVGDVLEARGEMEEALAAFRESLLITRQLVELQPTNAFWQRALAVACARVARLVLETEGPSAAMPFYEEANRIFSSLVQSAPDVVRWAEDKKRIETELALCRTKSK
jgi:tetratricopeptide (TPR) repeat protein